MSERHGDPRDEDLEDFECSPEVELITDYLCGGLPEAELRSVSHRLETDRAFYAKVAMILVTWNIPPAPCHFRPPPGRRPIPALAKAAHRRAYLRLRGYDRSIYRLVHDEGESLERAAWFTDRSIDDARARLVRANFLMFEGMWKCGLAIPDSWLDDLLTRSRERHRRLSAERAARPFPDFFKLGEKHRTGDPRTPAAEALKPSIRRAVGAITSLQLDDLAPAEEAAVLRRLRSDMEFYGMASYILLAWTVDREEVVLDGGEDAKSPSTR